MGAEVKDCRKIAELIGIKTFTTEFIAFKRLAVLIGNKKTFRNYTSNFNMTTDWMYSNEDIVLVHGNTTLIGGILSVSMAPDAVYKVNFLLHKFVVVKLSLYLILNYLKSHFPHN